MVAESINPLNRRPVSGPPRRRGRGRHTAPGTTARWVREGGFIVIVALTLALLLRLFVVQTFFIPSGSMEPTLNVGDRILVNKLSYHLHSVHRGDVIVFKRPADEDCGGPPVSDLVKRVIGLPGETISLNAHGHVEINGRILDETWLPASAQDRTYPGPPATPFNLTHSYKIPTS